MEAVRGSGSPKDGEAVRGPGSPKEDREAVWGLGSAKDREAVRGPGSAKEDREAVRGPGSPKEDREAVRGLGSAKEDGRISERRWYFCLSVVIAALPPKILGRRRHIAGWLSSDEDPALLLGKVLLNVLVWLRNSVKLSPVGSSVGGVICGTRTRSTEPRQAERLNKTLHQSH